jgi:hypothetical protein
MQMSLMEAPHIIGRGRLVERQPMCFAHHLQRQDLKPPFSLDLQALRDGGERGTYHTMSYKPFGQKKDRPSNLAFYVCAMAQSLLTF